MSEILGLVNNEHQSTKQFFLLFNFSEDRNDVKVIDIIQKNEQSFNQFSYHKPCYSNYTHSKTLQKIRERNDESLMHTSLSENNRKMNNRHPVLDLRREEEINLVR